MAASEEQEAIPRKGLGGSDPIFGLGCCLPIGVEFGGVWDEEWLGLDKICGISESPGERATKWSRGVHQTMTLETTRKKEEEAHLVYVPRCCLPGKLLTYSRLNQVLHNIIKLNKDLSTLLVQPLCIGRRIATRAHITVSL